MHVGNMHICVLRIATRWLDVCAGALALSRAHVVEMRYLQAGCLWDGVRIESPIVSGMLETASSLVSKNRDIHFGQARSV